MRPIDFEINLPKLMANDFQSPIQTIVDFNVHIARAAFSIAFISSNVHNAHYSTVLKVFFCL